MLVFSADIGFAYLINIGKNHLDLVLPFKQALTGNLCFRKIALFPGTTNYNHHFSIMYIEDFNEEVLAYLRMAYINACK